MVILSVKRQSAQSPRMTLPVTDLFPCNRQRFIWVESRLDRLHQKLYRHVLRVLGPHPMPRCVFLPVFVKIRGPLIDRQPCVCMARKDRQFAQVHPFDAKQIQLKDLTPIVDAFCTPFSDWRRLPNGGKQKGQKGEKDGGDHGRKVGCFLRLSVSVLFRLSPKVWGKSQVEKSQRKIPLRRFGAGST